MPTSSLIGLAYLNVTWTEGGGTYIDTFLPLLCQVVQNSDDEIVTEPMVRDGILEQFGLSIPQHTVGTLIRRARRQGFLRRKNRVFYPDHERLSEVDLSATRDRVVRLYEATVGRLVEYCDSELDLNWGTDQADQALQDYLAEYNLDVVLSHDEQSDVPAASGGPDSRKVVSLFITNLQENEPAVFDLVVDLFRGAMLKNAVYVDDPHNIAETFGDTQVFLDSPVLLDAVGYGFEERVRPQRELVELLQELGADVSCFRATVEEARYILETCATIMRQSAEDDAHDPVREKIDFFHNTKRTSSDVDRIAGRLDDKLAVMGISIVVRPEYDRSYQIDEPGFEAALRGEIGDYRREAVQHDVDAVSGIARLRRGQPKSNIAHCDAIFVSHNSALVRVSKRFFAGEELEGSVPLAVTDYHMTNLAWLKRPTEAPDLPLKRVIADCHAAIQPSDDLWDRLLREARRLRDKGEITAEDYLHIRHSQEVKIALAEETLGDEEAVIAGTVSRVLERARRITHREMQEALAKAEGDRRASQEALTDRISTDRRRLVTIASWLARLVEWAAMGVGFVLLAFGFYMLFPFKFPAFEAASGGYIGSIILAMFAVFLLYSRLFGKGWADIAGNLRHRTYRYVRRRLLSLWNLEPESTDD